MISKKSTYNVDTTQENGMGKYTRQWNRFEYNTIVYDMEKTKNILKQNISGWTGAETKIQKVQ